MVDEFFKIILDLFFLIKNQIPLTINFTRIIGQYENLITEMCRY